MRPGTKRSTRESSQRSGACSQTRELRQRFLPTNHRLAARLSEQPAYIRVTVVEAPCSLRRPHLLASQQKPPPSCPCIRPFHIGMTTLLTVIPRSEATRNLVPSFERGTDPSLRSG